MEPTPSFPRIYRTAVARLLGQPVFSTSAPCPLCQQTMDLLGDHPLCCKKPGDRITRHNRLRNLLFKLADTGLLAPEMEKLGILGETNDVYSVKWNAKMRQLQCPDKGRGGKCMDLELGPRHAIDTIPVQNLLRNRVLNTARQTRPSTSCIHSVVK